MRAMLSRLTPSLLAIGLSFAALSLSACKKPEYPKCKKDKHCNVDLDEKCVDGQCQNCKADADCSGKGPNGAVWKCIDFRCQDPALAGAGSGGGAGSPCAQTIDCSGGLVCKAGTCGSCTDDLDCQPGTCNVGTGTCNVPGAGGAGQCSTDMDCAMDEICDLGACVFSGQAGVGGANPCPDVPKVYFAFDNPVPDAADQEKLKQLAECLKTNPNQTLVLEAHADSRGTEEYNIMLTDKRGNNIKDFLQNLGVDPSRMTVVSKGDLEATGTDEGGMKEDRRVEFLYGQ